MEADSSPLVGVILLCAKTDELAEIEAVVASHFGRAARDTAAHSTYVLADRTETDPGEVMLLVTHNTMGNVASASLTGHLAARFKPNLMIFVGTGGSLRPDQCRIGDVVVPDLGAETRYVDNIKDDGRIGILGRPKWPVEGRSTDLRSFSRGGHIYSHRPKNDKIGLTGRAQKFISLAKGVTTNGQSSIQLGLHPWEQDRTPEVHTNVIMFSWEMVLHSIRYRDLLLNEIDSKAIGVDMESYGFLKAAAFLNEPGIDRPLSTIIVRGISDICGEKEKAFAQGSDKLALQNATTVACRILRDGYLRT
jgi:nucleoside phosphorylase